MDVWTLKTDNSDSFKSGAAHDYHVRQYYAGGKWTTTSVGNIEDRSEDLGVRGCTAVVGKVFKRVTLQAADCDGESSATPSGGLSLPHINLPQSGGEPRHAKQPQQPI
ncbi:hypothetical protein SprV_0200959600 [Sparganum proliferum]